MKLTPVGTANPKVAGFTQPNIVSPELEFVSQAPGWTALENGTAAVQKYGHDNNGPELPVPPAFTTEATKTEPEKNKWVLERRDVGEPH